MWGHKWEAVGSYDCPPCAGGLAAGSPMALRRAEASSVQKENLRADGQAVGEAIASGKTVLGNGTPEQWPESQRRSAVLPPGGQGADGLEPDSRGP